MTIPTEQSAVNSLSMYKPLWAIQSDPAMTLDCSHAPSPLAKRLPHRLEFLYNANQSWNVDGRASTDRMAAFECMMAQDLSSIVTLA